MFCLVYVLALVSIFLIAIPVWIKLVIFLVVIYLGIITIKKHALLNDNNSINRIICTGNDKCKIEFNSGHLIQAKIISVRSLFNYFIVMVIKDNKKNITSIIAKDSISQEQFYTLRLYLRSINK